jgi:AMP-binding enzyme C-terminal domain
MRPRAFHTYGFCYGLVGPLVTGAPVHWCPPRSVPSQLGRAVRGSGARTLIALPAQGPPSEGIRLAGRRSSVINVAAEKVSPAEVERVLAAHPQVVDVQVIGAPDPLRVQVPVARVVVSDAAATREAR